MVKKKTARSAAAKLSFRHFSEALSNFCRLPGPPNLVVIYGPSIYLRYKAVEALSKQASAWGYETERLSANNLDESQLDQIFQDMPLFGNQKYFVVENMVPSSRQAKLLGKLLSQHPKRAFLALQLNSSQIGATFEALHAEAIIPCYPPNTKELPNYIRSLARKFSLQLDSTAAQWLNEHVGNDLWKLENEIKNLALIYPEAEHLSDRQLQDALGYLKEDHVFELEGLILKKQSGKAINLINQLIHRGESPLAILGIISNHCRKILQIQSLRMKGQPPAQIAKELRLPLFVIQKLMTPLSAARLKAYRAAIELCQQNDIMLKSTRIGGDLLISHLLLELMSA